MFLKYQLFVTYHLFIDCFTTFSLVCSNPPSIANGSIVTSSSDSAPYFAGNNVTYQCDTGFTANNPANLTNRCVFGNTNFWERDLNALFSVCQPSMQIL